MVKEMTLTLNSPITDEQWDAITDVDFEHTDRIWFKTKHGKEVEFVKRKKGKWVNQKGGGCCCSECGRYALDEIDGNFIHVAAKSNFCPHCGVDMKGD